MGFSVQARGGTFGQVLALGMLVMAVSLVSSSTAAGATIESGSKKPRTAKVSASNVVSETVASPASAERFWTPARIASARPAPMPTPAGSFDVPNFGDSDASASAATGDFTPGNVTGFPQVVHGKILFQVGADTFSCSGTIVDSKNRNVIYTAGHCVYDRESASFASNVVFIPAYENGASPLGFGTATTLLTTSRWVNKGDNAYDVGVVVLDQPAQDYFGARKVAFDLYPRNREYTLYGYPSKPSPPFDGEVLRGCHSVIIGQDNQRGQVIQVPRKRKKVRPLPLAASPCSMQQGASGGGWVTLGNYLNSVVSYGYCDTLPRTCGVIFGTFFSNAAKSLYVKAGGAPAPTVKLLKAPPKVVRKRAVRFRFGGTAATLLGFTCRLDRQKAVDCSSKITIRRLSPGKHTLRVRAVDQTGRKSKGQIVRSFRVKLKRR